MNPARLRIVAADRSRVLHKKTEFFIFYFFKKRPPLLPGETFGNEREGQTY
jgi:hypothetical protein